MEPGQSNMIYPFASDHDKKLTWDVMLRQTSDWEGTLWGKPDWADRPEGDIEQYKLRKRNEPGTVYKYNDVRVNALALAALKCMAQATAASIEEYIMDPIGASNTWRWFGYQNSWIVLDGQAVQSVSGGGHWGGGMFINAMIWGFWPAYAAPWQLGREQLFSEQWAKQALTPTKANPGYGYMNCGF